MEMLKAETPIAHVSTCKYNLSLQKTLKYNAKDKSDIKSSTAGILVERPYKRYRITVKIVENPYKAAV